MPPANSPQEADPPISFITALRELESPGDEDVLNLADTLGTPTPPDARERFPSAAEIRSEFLRRQREEREVQARLDRSREHLRLLERQRDDSEQRDRLRRVMSRLSRLDNDSSAAYGDRVPSANSLYDWSPATEADDAELDHILDELRSEQPNTHPDILRVLGRSQLEAERERTPFVPFASGRAGGGGESLRSTAILQSVRRHPRFSARTREYLQRYNSERDGNSRPSPHADSQGRYMSESARQMAMQRLAASENRQARLNAGTWDSENRSPGRNASTFDRLDTLDRDRRDMLSRTDSLRRTYLDHHTSTSTPSASPLLEQTVNYLSRIRHSDTIDDSLNHALDAGFLSKDYFCIQYADFLTDTSALSPPAQTSWLAPGAVLSGSQQATSVAATLTTTRQFLAGTDMSRFDTSGLAPPSRPWLANSYSTPRSRSAYLSPEATPPPNPQHDSWPVKVTIHEVDWEKMSLSATMEAYNVPSHPHTNTSLLSTDNSPQQQQYTRTSSITTYLEGEILDFNTHTLLTESFKSSPATDATYWRKLPPFASMSDDEVVKALTSKKWFDNVLHREYVLMRWKERCFVKSLNRSTPDPLPNSHAHHTSNSDAESPYRLVRHPETNALQVEYSSGDSEHATFEDSGCGLTISGFYFVVLRRRDGLVHGLYYDPQSSPYQCLELRSGNGGRGAWGFA